jgi:hypothetical protein
MRREASAAAIHSYHRLVENMLNWMHPRVSLSLQFGNLLYPAANVGSH